MEELWITPRFYDERPCPQCGITTPPKPPYRYSKEPPFQAICQCCLHSTDSFPTWREALKAFYGELPGRSPQFGPPVGSRIVARESEPIGCYPLRGGLVAGDILRVIDFHVGAFTVQRESDELEAVVAHQNLGEVLPELVVG